MKRNATHCNDPRNGKSEEQMRAEGRVISRLIDSHEPLRETGAAESNTQSSLEEVIQQ